MIYKQVSTESMPVIKKPQLDYHSKLTFEIEKCRHYLENYYSNYHIIDIENRIRNNKRIIVNMLTDNIFMLRFGFKDSVNVIRKVNHEDQLIRMVYKRERRIKVIENLIKQAKDRGMEIATWLLHSNVVALGMKVRVLEDIVLLCQEKNLYLEATGATNFVKVGVIEEQVDWALLNRNKYGSMKSKDYYSRKMAMQTVEYNTLFDMVTHDAATNDQIKKEMVQFINRMFGNAGWERLVLARWLKQKQTLQ